MKYTKITKKDLVQAIMQLKEQLYDATVTEHVEPSPEDLTSQTPYLDKYKYNRELLDESIQWLLMRPYASSWYNKCAVSSVLASTNVLD